MKTLQSILVLAVAFAFGSVSRADEEKNPLHKVPANVKEAVENYFPDAQFISAEQETENGKVLYEIVIRYMGKKFEVLVSADGVIEAVETEIDLRDLAKSITDYLAKNYLNAKIGNAEKVVDSKGRTTYEVVVHVGGKKYEFTFDANGIFWK